MEKSESPKSHNSGVVEQFFIDHGSTAGILLFAALAIVLFFLCTLYYIRLKREKNDENAKAEMQEKTIAIKTSKSQATRKTKFLQTPEGMSIALLLGTLLACLVGFVLVGVYKWAGLDDDFGQGSGSLIQAIWGSAATITAAVVAIMLALEAIKTAETTNKLQMEANQLSEYESPAYAILTEISIFKRRIDQYAMTLFPTLALSDGQVINRNANDYERSLFEFFSLCQDIYNSESFILLDEIPLSSLKDARSEDAIIRTLPELFTMDPFSKEIRPPNCSDLIVMLKQFSDQTSIAVKSMETIDLKAKLLNSLGRAHWEYMYTLKIALNHIKYIDIVNYTYEKMKLSDSRPNPIKIHDFDKVSGHKNQQNQHPSRADNILHQLALLLINRKNEEKDESDDAPSATENAYNFLKENLVQMGSQFLEKLKIIAKDENAPKSLRVAANKIIEENS